jgi:tartrate/fumarate subfamily iron-sulfur-dependent hydro-lyase beta chain
MNLPLSEERVRKLRVGERMELSGVIFTARDKAHLFFLESDILKDKINQGVLYHCGPIVKDGRIISAGPTTSERLSLYAPEVIKKYHIRAVIGKGGMDEKTLSAMKKYGCVYLAAIGGAGALMASGMKLKNVYKPEFGMPEAIYEIEVEKMPLIVGMDANGRSIYKNVLDKSRQQHNRLISKQ